jgi:transcriptional regulator with XRE-family HTH domain
MDNAQIDNYSKAVASLLRQHYEASGLSYSAISDATGLARSTVVRVINGEREATAYYLHKLCEVFGVTPGSVLDAADNAG